MAVYKVIQDIEAEDKILGPLTLKSFIYALIAGALAFVAIRLAISGIGDAKWAVIILLLPPIAIFGLLAAPIGKDQPTEVWILSHVRFFLQDRKRYWDQSGVEELVTITAPKRIEKVLTKDFSQEEVRGRLKALAATLDSHGWAVKNVITDIYGQPAYFMNGAGDSDRLVGASSLSMAQPQPVLDVHADDDILDENANATAQNFNQLMQDADAKRRESLMEMVSSNTYPSTETTAPRKVTAPKALPTDVELGDTNLRDKHPHFQTKPSLADEQRAMAQQKQATQQQPVAQTQAPDPVVAAVKADLAKSNDISVASVSKLANHHETIRQISANEVEIRLH